jgi:hypothetical protein
MLAKKFNEKPEPAGRRLTVDGGGARGGEEEEEEEEEEAWGSTMYALRRASFQKVACPDWVCEVSGATCFVGKKVKGSKAGRAKAAVKRDRSQDIDSQGGRRKAEGE